MDMTNMTDWKDKLKQIKDAMTGGGDNSNVSLDKGPEQDPATVAPPTPPSQLLGGPNATIGPVPPIPAPQAPVPPPMPVTPPVAPAMPSPAPVAAAPEPPDAESKVLAALGQSQDIDSARRKKFQEALEAKKQNGIGATLGGGIADAFAAANRARFGSNVPETSFAKQAQESLDKSVTEDKTNFEEGLKTDPTSGISKQYQESAKLFLGGKSSPLWEGKSAAQIAATLPTVEKYLQNKLTREQIATSKKIAADSSANTHQDKLEQDHAQRLAKIYSNRSGGLGLQDAKVNAAIHARQLIEGARDPKTGEVSINQITSPELAQSVATIVSSGNAPALETIQKMTPEALSGYIKSQIGYIFGKPVSVLPKEWVDSLQHQIDRQGQTSEMLRNKELNALKGIRPTALDTKRAQTLEDNISRDLPSYTDMFKLPAMTDYKSPNDTSDSKSPVTISSRDEYNALPTGSLYIDGTGKTKRKK